MIRRLRWLVLAIPLLLGADCPGDETVKRWVVVDVLPGGVSSEYDVPAQTQAVYIEFSRENASQDIELQESLNLEGTVHTLGEADSDPTDAFLRLESLDNTRVLVAEAKDGIFTWDGVPPGSYELMVIPDESLANLGIHYEEVTLPDDLTVLDSWDLYLSEGDHELAAIIADYDVYTVPPSTLGLPHMFIEAFTELEPGVLRRAGPRIGTDTNGRFSLMLKEGTYTLRISSLSTAEVPYPTALIHGFQVPEDIEALQAEVTGEALPYLFVYPHFQPNSLSGTLIATAPMVDGLPEGQATVSIYGVVEAPEVYLGLDEVDFDIGYIETRLQSDDLGGFSMVLPPAIYSMAVVPGHYSDSSSLVMDGEQALDLTEDNLQLGDVELDSKVYLFVVALDSRDRFVEGARVEVRNLGESGYVQGLLTDENGATRFFVEQGEHLVIVDPPEDADLARHTEYVSVSNSPHPPIAAILEEGIHVTGRISLDGDLLGGVQVRFSDPADGSRLGTGVSRNSGTYDLQIPTEWVWDDESNVGDDDTSP